MKIDNLKNKYVELCLKIIYTIMRGENMIELKNVEIPKEEQKFWNWIFGKETKVIALLDTTPIKVTGKNKFIYMQQDIYEYTNTPAMERTKRLEQIGIGGSSDSYQNRFLHQIQAYANKIDLIKSKYQNSSWRKEIELQDKKIYLIAECIKTLTHDIGHAPRTHAMENAITWIEHFHEVIGRKIVLEQKNSIEKLKQINPHLINALKMVYERDVFGFELFDEGNIDVDRCAYLPTDIAYEEEIDESVFKMIDELIKQHCTKTVITIGNGIYKEVRENELLNSKKIEVYPNNQITNIENFLKLRAQRYKQNYYGKEKSLKGLMCRELVQYISSRDVKTDTKLKEFIVQIATAGKMENVDIEEYIKWDDIRFNMELIKIAKNEDEKEEVRQLAIGNLPDFMKIMNEAYAYIDLSKEINEEEKQYIKEIRDIVRGNSEVDKQIKKDRKSLYTVLETEDDKEMENVIEQIQNQTNIKKDDIYMSKTLTVYNPKEPIYVENHGIIYEYSHLPNRTIDIYRQKVQNVYIIPFLLEIKGYRQKQIKKATEIIQNYNRGKELLIEKGEVKGNFSIFPNQEKAQEYFIHKANIYEEENQK